MTNRTSQGTAATLAYDALDHLVKWSNGSGSTESYAYDATGNRTLRRSTTGGTTTLTIYTFGVEEHLYSGTGSSQGHTYYYTLGGRLIGERTTSPAATTIFLTDALGSVLMTFSNAVGSAAVLGSQVYGPYGTQRYASGSMGTSKGFTGQYNDTLTGLDYYNARYYDPVVGVFLSADTVQGNLQGLNPYNYVGGNPETKNDPTGQYIPCPDGGCGGGGGGGGNPNGNQGNNGGNSSYGGGNSGGVPLSGGGRRLCVLNGGCGQRTRALDRTDLMFICEASTTCKAWMFNRDMEFVKGLIGLLWMLYDLAHGVLPEQGLDASTSEAEMSMIALEEDQAIASELANEGVFSQSEAAGICSFTPTTQVMTEHGSRPIEKLHVGEKVLAYNAKTHKMELESIVHVWIHSDDDLVDLTITMQTKSRHGTASISKGEVIHTNKKHPFFTTEHGFLPVGQITIGMHILRADNSTGVITRWKLVPGIMTMYNLEVAQDHTYTVGIGQWVVHNCDLTITGTQYSSEELSAAKYVASIKTDPGDSVTLRDPGSNRAPDGDTSDLVVNGVNYDIYTPEAGTSIKTILSVAAGKYTQARGVVIDLSKTGLSASSLGGNPLARIQGYLRSWGVDPSAIQDVIIYDP